jgi:hypothetical protein
MMVWARAGLRQGQVLGGGLYGHLGLGKAGTGSLGIHLSLGIREATGAGRLEFLFAVLGTGQLARS